MTTIKSLINGNKIIYKELDPLEDLKGKILQAVHVFCFYKDKMVLVNHSEIGWTPPGGKIEKGETYKEAIVREVKEETGMDVVYQKLIGFQDIYEPGGTIRQVRSFCVVKPCGDCINDPDGEIEEIRLINPKNYKEYFDWGEIGERIIEKAIILNNEGSSIVQ